MVAPLQTTSLVAPAFFGLNTTDSEVTLDPKFARVANNCIIDEGGRLGARKGWQYTKQIIVSEELTYNGIYGTVYIPITQNFVELEKITHGFSEGDVLNIRITKTSTGETKEIQAEVIDVIDVDTFRIGSNLSGENLAAWSTFEVIYADSDVINLKGMHRFLDIDGAEYFGAWSDDTFYVESPSGSNTLVEVTYSDRYDATTNPTGSVINDGNWQAATLNDAAYLFQRGYKPLYFSPTTGVLDDIENQGKGTPPQGNTVLSAYGRLWVADTPNNKTTVYWSNLLDGAEWRSGTGTVGSLDISSILVYGNDEIVGLGAHNGYLIIFCKNNIIIMGDSDNQDKYLDPVNMQLIEVIHGTGCIARDSIANTGTDILFLSESGVRSLGRTIQEKSQPMRDISRNIRDQLVAEVSRENKDLIKAVYSESNGFYLLTLPTDTSVYCFDMKMILPDGSARVTQWSNLNHTSWLGFDGTLYMTNTRGIAEYKGYQDNGNSYTMSYQTNYFDFGSANIVKFLKNISATIIGSTGKSLSIKVYRDYENIEYEPVTLTLKSGGNAEYGVAEYGIAEYSGGSLTENLKVPVGGSGFVIKLGIESEINGGFLNIQQLNLYAKQGRLN